MQPVITLGSSRKLGNTYKLALRACEKAPMLIFDLLDYDIGPFDYEFKNKDDDFLPLIKKVIEFDNIILATPVYWYSPSSILKTFMDRIQEIRRTDRILADKIKSKTAALIATGADETPNPYFENIFKNTYQYLKMN